MAQPPPTQLIVFADDWGRHPSSCQHLVRHLLREHPTLWVNTIGMRRPQLTIADLGRATGKFKAWLSPRRQVDWPDNTPENLQVISPRMFPGFRQPWQRRVNSRSIAKAVNRALGIGQPHTKRIVLTTLPITADLADSIDADRWVYYCVDDFSVWPGLDGPVMAQMEQQLVERADSVVCVSSTLQKRIEQMGKTSTLLTHGIDLELWTDVREQIDLAGKPSLLFWGLVDGRMDIQWCQAIGSCDRAVLHMLGLRDNTADTSLRRMAHVHFGGPVAFNRLPSFAAAADVLVMPYIDAPVTRAMQPLKFKEYLATGKPVVARDLPATRPWADCCDLVTTADDFAQLCMERARTGLPDSQRVARRRLEAESWSEKAKQLCAILHDQGDSR